MKTQTEQTVSLPVINPDTGEQCETFAYMGKTDLVHNGVVIDWKSASDPSATVREKSISFQPELYALALMAAGYDIREVEYRIIARPSIKVSAADRKAAGDGDVYEAYEERCFDWLTGDSRKMITMNCVLTESRLAAARRYLWDCAKRVESNRESDTWLPNAGACHQWGRACEFMPLCEAACSGGDVGYLVDSLYDKKDDPHQELKEDTNRDVLRSRQCPA